MNSDHFMMMKCLNWNKAALLFLVLFIQLQALACKRITTYLPCFSCNCEQLLQYIDKRAAATGSNTCYVDILSSSTVDSRTTIVVNFTYDVDLFLNLTAFGVIKLDSCLIVLSGEENSTLIEKIPSKHQKVKVIKKCISELDDGIIESFVMKDGSIYKQDWLGGKLVPMSDAFQVTDY